MSEQDAASSAESEIDENTLTNIPININDKDLIKKITTQVHCFEEVCLLRCLHTNLDDLSQF